MNCRIMDGFKKFDKLPFLLNYTSMNNSKTECWKDKNVFSLENSPMHLMQVMQMPCRKYSKNLALYAYLRMHYEDVQRF